MMKIKDILTEGYEAFVLDEQTRQELLKQFPPKFPEWIGHHITHRFGISQEKHQPSNQLHQFKVVGYAEDVGIEALVVAVDGNTKRPDGKVYHVTWSLDRAKGRKPVDSNKVIAEKGYTKVKPLSFTASLEYLI